MIFKKSILPKEALLQKDYPVILAHRGGRGLWPENTLFAFQQAVALGVDALEFDIRCTRDGVLVVIHDDSVDRTTNGKGFVHELTLQELQQLDAGYWWTDDQQNYPYRGKGIRVPTLEEVFQFFSGVWMNIDIKQHSPSIVEHFASEIRKFGKEEEVLVASFDHKTIQNFRHLCPNVLTTASLRETKILYILAQLFLNVFYSKKIKVLQIPPEYEGRKLLGGRFMSAIHHRKILLHLWTINDIDEMQRFLKMGVHGFVTDYPDRLLKALGRN